MIFFFKENNYTHTLLPLLSEAMQVRSIPLTEDYTIQIFEHISDIPEAEWNAISEKILFYQTHQFLQIIESIHSSILFRYILVYQQERIVAALYMQLLDFSFRNLVNYNASATAGLRNKFKQYIATKHTKLLNLGNVFFTGDRGIICKQDENIIPLIPDLFRLTNDSFNKNKPKAYLVANIYLQDQYKCNSFGNNAFHPFATEPDMFMKIDNEWKCFDDYVAALSSKYRVRTNKVLTVSKEIQSVDFSLEEIKKYKTDIQLLYNNVVNHVAFNMASLNVDFFENMKALYVDRFRMMAYFYNDVLVGFACLFNIDVDTLHVHYIGLNYDINKEYKLYNRMLLDFVRFAIENNKRQVHFGRTATEIKTTIGAIPQSLQAYLKMNNRLVNTTLPYFLKRIKPAEFIARNPFRI